MRHVIGIFLLISDDNEGFDDFFTFVERVETSGGRRASLSRDGHRHFQHLTHSQKHVCRKQTNKYNNISFEYENVECIHFYTNIL